MLFLKDYKNSSAYILCNQIKERSSSEKIYDQIKLVLLV